MGISVSHAFLDAPSIAFFLMLCNLEDYCTALCLGAVVLEITLDRRNRETVSNLQSFLIPTQL